ncbi:MAG TPA: alpha-amylase family glycosyl hydrolase [Blastocatellia bacterium]|nr:alpha-amylase family glycosyl hydrolase [Blastocatellia bacterium]
MRIYEINTRLHCQQFDDISQSELNELSRLGFDTVWFMGVWQISKGAYSISKIVSEDFEGSPYAVPQYQFNRSLGGKSQFKSLVKRARQAGLSVIVDFVSNHMAIDSPWIDEDPQLFIRSDSRMRSQSTSEYYLHSSGEVVAFGRDPFFPPWHDTAQLDFSNPALRTRMIDVLKTISKVVDGVRCDMAMLILKDYFRDQWYPYAPEGWFDLRWSEEFWSQAIREVKAQRPDFRFIAETYWDKEPELLDLGFDLTYEKKLYDGLVERNAGKVNEQLSVSGPMMRGSLYFIENHDEPRAASVFKKKDNLASAALILSLPGSSLIHEGQMEGKRERLPVQRIKPLSQEHADLALMTAYIKILTATSHEVFRSGAFQLFDSRVWGAVSFIRENAERVVAYLGQISDAWHRFNGASFDITPLARAVGAGNRMRVSNLLNDHSIFLEKSGGEFRLQPYQLGVEDEAEFCLIEAGVE